MTLKNNKILYLLLFTFELLFLKFYRINNEMPDIFFIFPFLVYRLVKRCSKNAAW